MLNLTVREEQLRALADAAPNRPVLLPCADSASWIEFVLVDEDGEPVADEPYEIRLSDHSLHTGRLDGQGKVRLDGIVPGTASIRFPAIDGREWRPA